MKASPATNTPAQRALPAIVVIDDEWTSKLVTRLVKRLEAEPWRVYLLAPEAPWLADASLPLPGEWPSGQWYEDFALFGIERAQPDGVLLDVKFGDGPADRFRGLSILGSIVRRYPHLPVLVYTQYAGGPERERAACSSLRRDSPVDFVDKLASPEEIVVRLRRVIRTTPEVVPLAPRAVLDFAAQEVLVNARGQWQPVPGITSMKFSILQDLAAAWRQSPSRVVTLERLERHSEAVPKAISEIKDQIGAALGVELGRNDLIISVHGKGYRLEPLRET